MQIDKETQYNILRWALIILGSLFIWQGLWLPWAASFIAYVSFYMWHELERS